MRKFFNHLYPKHSLFEILAQFPEHHRRTLNIGDWEALLIAVQSLYCSLHLTMCALFQIVDKGVFACKI
jgi:hypothetical protein